LADAARAYQEITGRRRRIFEVPVPGKTARAFREGALICPEGAHGEIRWEDFLRSRIGARSARVSATAERSSNGE
jgi:hypothetical protein